jgi:hypothetical protein
MPENPVIHVDDALPLDAPDVEPEGIVEVNVIVDESGQEIMSRSNGVEISGEVQVDVLHGHYLRPAPTGGAALHSKTRPERRLTQADHRPGADAVQGITQPHSSRGFALSRRGRTDGSHKNQLAIRPALKALDVVQRNLCLKMPVRVQVHGWNAQLLLCELHDRRHAGTSGNFDIAHRLILR